MSFVTAGAQTAALCRLRTESRGVNFYNWVEVGPERFTVAERRFDPGAGRFDEARQTTFARRSRGAEAPA